MLKDRSQLEVFLIEIFINNVTNSVGINAHQEWCLELSEKYNIPISMSSDYISRRRDLSECNEFILFAITDVVIPEKVSQYFTQTEIKMYLGKKLELDSIKFPLRISMIMIDEDQFIGKTTAQFLMKLREKQLINYNQDTQRALRVQIRGGEKILRPFVDSRAVTNIADMFADRSFIPNAITLNINFDDEKATWYYDERMGELVIKDITAFDITDGYHRYLAMGRDYDKDNSFDYPMILQITAFAEGKARQMIWQENQKTVMKESDLSVYNQNTLGSQIVDRINKDNGSNFYNLVNLADGLINSAIMADTINRLWTAKYDTRGQVVILAKTIMQKLNEYSEYNIASLTDKWKNYEVIIIMYGIKYEHTPEEIQNALTSISKEQKDIVSRQNKLSPKVLNIMKEVYGDA